MDLGIRGRKAIVAGASAGMGKSSARALAREGVSAERSELEAAQRRIAELERKVGQQAVELDFFQGALRRIKASRPVSE